MLKFRALVGAALLVAMAVSAPAADEVIEAIDQARKSYQSGDLANAKQALDLASQLIGQKNAESFGALLPAPLPGWKAEKSDEKAARTGGLFICGWRQSGRHSAGTSS